MTTYLCGGINGLSDSDCRDWREVAKSELFTPTLDPMRRDYRGKEDESVREIVEGDLDDIDRSDFVLVNATRPSWGTAMEIVYAYQASKVVVSWVGQSRVSPWLRFHSSEIHATLEEAIGSINMQVAGEA
jgi:nucleoside 2-deoxyribosyltransferase